MDGFFRCVKSILKYSIAFMLISTGASHGSSVHILVDQFGWRPNAASKVAIFASPTAGQNRDRSYSPGRLFEVRSVEDHKPVFRGKVEKWKNGAIDSKSGDAVGYGNFSALTAAGRFYVFDPLNNSRSPVFAIHDDVYKRVLHHAVRAFYYQRCGVEINTTFGVNWTHPECHLQQSNCLPAPGGSLDRRTSRELTGGFHDAGDYNKYSPFLAQQLYDLLLAFEINPTAFGDDGLIPESGNGVPDILDEVKWGLDWLMKMQDSDGGIFNRVGADSYRNGIDDPSTDKLPYYFTAKTTWATASFAAVTAYASRVFKLYEPKLNGYHQQLATAGEKAWGYLETKPRIDPADGTDGANLSAAAMAKSDARDDMRRRLLAAVELLKTTQNDTYAKYFEKNFREIGKTQEDGFHPLQSGFFDPAKTSDLVRAFFSYRNAPSADQRIINEIKALFKTTVESQVEKPYNSMEDAYRAYMWEDHYCWGSNAIKTRWAMFPVMAIEIESDPDRKKRYMKIAEEYLHYLHGRNPLGVLYLSNMGEKGAKLISEDSVMEIFHFWFRDKSKKYDGIKSLYGPAPGFLAGGPNKFYTGSKIPPKNEPPMKAFYDWNSLLEPENSWEITEPSLSYQAAYILLLSQFCK